MAFIPELTDREELIELYNFWSDEFKSREKALDRKAAELAERERRIEQRECELWGGLDKPRSSGKEPIA